MQNYKEYIYLIIEREFISSNKKIYKIGKSKQENAKRTASYPKGSVLLYTRICKNCTNCEKELISLFRQKYIERKDIGNEYFEGDSDKMIDDIHSYINNESARNVLTEEKKWVDDDTNPKDINTYDKYIKNSQLGEILLTNVSLLDGIVRFPKRNNFYNIQEDKKCSAEENLLLWMKKNYTGPECDNIYNFIYNFTDKACIDFIEKLETLKTTTIIPKCIEIDKMIQDLKTNKLKGLSYNIQGWEDEECCMCDACTTCMYCEVRKQSYHISNSHGCSNEKCVPQHKLFEIVNMYYHDHSYCKCPDYNSIIKDLLKYNPVKKYIKSENEWFIEFRDSMQILDIKNLKFKKVDPQMYVVVYDSKFCSYNAPQVFNIKIVEKLLQTYMNMDKLIEFKSFFKSLFSNQKLKGNLIIQEEFIPNIDYYRLISSYITKVFYTFFNNKYIEYVNDMNDIDKITDNTRCVRIFALDYEKIIKKIKNKHIIIENHITEIKNNKYVTTYKKLEKKYNIEKLKSYDFEETIQYIEKRNNEKYDINKNYNDLETIFEHSDGLFVELLLWLLN
jgi:hypothetical protein